MRLIATVAMALTAAGAAHAQTPSAGEVLAANHSAVGDRPAAGARDRKSVV